MFAIYELNNPTPLNHIRLRKICDCIHNACKYHPVYDFKVVSLAQLGEGCILTFLQYDNICYVVMIFYIDDDKVDSLIIY